MGVRDPCLGRPAGLLPRISRAKPVAGFGAGLAGWQIAVADVAL